MARKFKYRYKSTKRKLIATCMCGEKHTVVVDDPNNEINEETLIRPCKKCTAKSKGIE